MEIRFLGGAGTVTGSKFLLTADGQSILVDCGLYQGLKPLRLRNWERLPVDPNEISAIVLTHAHIDHSGYIPLAVKSGFSGNVYCTAPTRDLCHILLPDCGRLHEEDAAYANRKGYSKHKPALPLYTEADAQRSLAQFKVVPLQQKIELGPFEVTFHRAGHILGAAHVLIKTKHRSVVFSGDLGRFNDLVELAPEPLPKATNIVMESTYGDRLHPTNDSRELLAAEIVKVASRGGVMLIPAFAVGRMQSLLYSLHEVFAAKLAPRLPVYVNSPMATSATEIYLRYPDWHRLKEQDCHKIADVAHFVRSPEESIALNHKQGPMIILSASGMLTGGRVLHHLRQFGPDLDNLILFAGFQAPGTRGASLVSGVKELKMHGQAVPINAEVVKLDAFSAHADQEDLLRWLDTAPITLQRVFLVHGEPEASAALAEKIRGRMGHKVHIPQPGELVNL